MQTFLCILKDLLNICHLHQAFSTWYVKICIKIVGNIITVDLRQVFSFQSPRCSELLWNSAEATGITISSLINVSTSSNNPIISGGIVLRIFAASLQDLYLFVEMNIILLLVFIYLTHQLTAKHITVASAPPACVSVLVKLLLLGFSW